MGEHHEFARVLKCGFVFMEFVCFVRSHLLWAMHQHIYIAQRWRVRNCGASCACWHLGKCHPVRGTCISRRLLLVNFCVFSVCSSSAHHRILQVNDDAWRMVEHCKFARAYYHFEGVVWSEILTCIRWWFLKLWSSCHCIFSAKIFSQANNVIIGMMEQIYTCVWHFDACRPGRATYFLAWWFFWN